MNLLYTDKNLTGGDCLSLDTMGRFVNGSLNPVEKLTVNNHIHGCELCAAVLDGMSKQDVDIIRNITSKVNARVGAITGTGSRTSFLNKYKIPITASVVGALLGTATLFLLNNNTAENQLSDASRAIEEPVKHQSHPGQAIKEEQVGTPGPLNEETGKVPSATSDKASEAQEMESNAFVAAEESGLSKQDPITVEHETSDKDEKQFTGSNAKNDVEFRGTHVLKVTSVKILNKSLVSGNNKNNRVSSSKSNYGMTGKKKIKTNYKTYNPGDMPEFYGGEPALEEYIKGQLQATTDEALSRKTVVVRFVVNSKGKISGTKAMSGISEHVDEAAVKIIEEMPDWEPGKKGKVEYILSIRFD